MRDSAHASDHLLEPSVVGVRGPGDSSVACRTARMMALAAGLGDEASSEVVLVVSELASNLIKHAHGGTLTFWPVAADGRRGIEIVSEDRGPGIPDPDRALVDGFSTAGGLGCGLGTVHRLMDTLDIQPREAPDGGARIVCRRWTRPERRDAGQSPLSIGVATRSRTWTDPNGDAFVARQWEGHGLAGVIDGLGHGASAHQAAEAARYYVERHFEQPLAALFHGVGIACHSTRGVVMALARFDLARRRFVFASVGNVEARVFDSPEPASLVVRRGVLGTRPAPKPVVTEHRWEPGTMLVLHSDGLSARWRWSDFPDLAGASAPIVAQGLLRALVRENDDATVLVVKQDR